jgi:hypothetical protein
MNEVLWIIIGAGGVIAALGIGKPIIKRLFGGNKPPNRPERPTKTVGEIVADLSKAYDEEVEEAKKANRESTKADLLNKFNKRIGGRE